MKKFETQKLKAGIFVVVGTLLLISGLYFIGNRQHIFSKNVEVYTVFENVNGLQLGNNVRYAGINVGTVSKIEMINEARIVVQMMVEEKTAVFIRKDAIASIGSDGLVGSMVLNIIPGKEGLPTIVSGDTITSFSKIGADDMLSTLNVTNENAALLTSDLLEITGKIRNGEGVLGALISDSLLTTDLRETLQGLNKTAQGANKAVEDINRIFSKVDMDNSLAGRLFNDSTLGNKMEYIVSNMENSSATISTITQNLDREIREIKNSQGAYRYFINDQNLPKEIDSTIQHIKDASIKLDENMEALRHNFFFRRYFKKKEKETKKNTN